MLATEQGKLDATCSDWKLSLRRESKSRSARNGTRSSAPPIKEVRCVSACGCAWGLTSESLGLVAQLIRHRPTEPGIAGSSPADHIPLSRSKHGTHAIATTSCTHMKCANRESNSGHKHGRLVCCRYPTGAFGVRARQRRPAGLL